MALSVVVVTYRSKEHILACLRSLAVGVDARAPGGPGLEGECVVVDNDSHDGTPALGGREAPWARLVRRGGTLGYARAVNRGFAETRGTFVLVSNPDCVWHAGAIRALVGWLFAHPRSGIAAPRVSTPRGSRAD